MSSFLSAKVGITGAVAVSCLGRDLASHARALASQERGISRDHRFGAYARGVLGTMPRAPFEGESACLGQHDSDGARAIAWTLAALAKETAVFERHAPERIGLFLGTANTGVDTMLDDVRFDGCNIQAEFLARLSSQQRANSLEQALRAVFSVRGPSFTFCSACSSAAHAIAVGALAVARGTIDAALVGGVDLLNPMALCGFESLQIIDADPCRPFCTSRSGVNLGEGGALLLLEKPRVGATPPVLAYVAGSGSASDAHHITNPEPSGEGMRLAMARALADAGIDPAHVGYVNAHGTGTQANDAAESKAIAALFGTGPAVSSTKGLHGHTLGSAGALEAVVAILALHEQTAWGGARLEGATYEPGVRMQEVSARADLRYVVSNSFGFGGNNVSLVLAAPTSR